MENNIKEEKYLYVFVDNLSDIHYALQCPPHTKQCNQTEINFAVVSLGVLMFATSLRQL